MNYEKNDMSGVCAIPRLDLSFGHDAGGDFSLPDYMPQIQRLLGVSGVVLPEGKFISSNVLETSGTVSYSVYYLSDEGKLCAASLVSEYTASSALPVSIDSISEIFCDCDIENTTCRVTSPRGVSIKSRLRTRAVSDEQICGEMSVVNSSGARAEGAEVQSVEKRCGTVSSMMRVSGMTTGNVTGEIKSVSGAKPLICDGALIVKDCEAKEDGVAVKGDILLRCIFEYTDGKYGFEKTKIPFDLTVPVKDIVLPSKARAWGRVASVSVSQSDEGEGVFSVSVEFDLEAEAEHFSSSVICSDAYSTDYESENEMRECDVLTPICFGDTVITLNGETEIKNLSPRSDEIDVTGTVSSLQIFCSDGVVTLGGIVKLRVIVTGDEIISKDVEIPLKYELCTDTDCRGFELQSRVTAAVVEATARASGDVISLSCDVAVSYNICEKRRECFVTSVKLGEAKSGVDGAEIRVYYPSDNESLWSICKKYRADRGKVAKANPNITETVSAHTPIIIC